ncbi:MAG TPA: S41 family peptidase, partial [Longimicrobium sp.]|nr:S41 family peptidase [Longimicrobium sp.]
HLPPSIIPKFRMLSHLRRRAPLLAAALLLAAGCDTGRGPTELPEPEQWIGPAARVYVDSALNLMQSYSLHRNEVDWPNFRAGVLRRVNGTQLPAQTHTAIHEALQSLDPHSFLIRPGAALEDELAQVGTVFGGKLLAGRFGYVRTAPVNGPALGHAQQYHDLIRDMDGAATCGWVVDLRFNGGGNMWPMLAGVGPILGEGSPGRFVDADGVQTPWFYEGGVAGMVYNGQKVDISAAGTPYQLRRQAPPVAVLTGPGTASAAEAVAIAFRGRPATRSFGTGTAGFPTANSGYDMPDGAIVVLTTAWEEDRNGVRYATRITPDEPTAGVPSLSMDPFDDVTLGTALHWLGTQPACQPSAG